MLDEQTPDVTDYQAVGHDRAVHRTGCAKKFFSLSIRSQNLELWSAFFAHRNAETNRIHEP